MEDVFKKEKVNLLDNYFPEMTINKKYFDLPSLNDSEVNDKNANKKSKKITKKINNLSKNKNKFFPFTTSNRYIFLSRKSS